MPMDRRANMVRLAPADNVAVALSDIAAGEMALDRSALTVTARERIPQGHKIALLPIGLSDGNDDLAIAGGITLAAGAVAVALGILAIRADADTYRPGAANHFSLTSSAAVGAVAARVEVPRALGACEEDTAAVQACLQQGPTFVYAREPYVYCSGDVAPADQLEAEVQKYALACAQNRPTDVIFIQKTFFEVMKQFQGEYMGSLISATLESLATYGKPDAQAEGADDTNARIDKGLTDAVKDFDSRFPPEWRLSKKGRAQPE